MQISVNVRLGTPNMLAKGMLANVEINIIDPADGKVFTECRGFVIRKGNDGNLFVSEPSTQYTNGAGETKRSYTTYFPDQEKRERLRNYILAEYNKALQAGGAQASAPQPHYPPAPQGAPQPQWTPPAPAPVGQPAPAYPYTPQPQPQQQQPAPQPSSPPAQGGFVI